MPIFTLPYYIQLLNHLTEITLSHSYLMPTNNNAAPLIITGKLKGMLGKEVVFRDWDGKTIAAKAPKPRKGAPTPAQADARERFLFASK